MTQTPTRDYVASLASRDRLQELNRKRKIQESLREFIRMIETGEHPDGC